MRVYSALRMIPILGLLAAAASLPASAGQIDKSCTYNGKKLWGSIQVVENFPDIKVKVVNDFPDLKVKVGGSSGACGEWSMVSSSGNTKIKFVNDFPDIKIKYVENFPGLP